MNFRPAVRTILRRCYSQQGSKPGKPQSSASKPTGLKPEPPKPAGVNANVPGLSNKCVKPFAGNNVGPGASPTGEYKVPEYFLYDKTSYAEAEIEMAKYRCPQPSALQK